VRLRFFIIAERLRGFARLELVRRLPGVKVWRDVWLGKTRPFAARFITTRTGHNGARFGARFITDLRRLFGW
jgi:hypothetical protein